MQAQDFALAREEVIFNVEPLHGFEVAAQNGGRDDLGNFRSFIAALFNLMQGLQTQLQMLFVPFVPL